MSRLGWTREGPPGKCGALWRHSSGWVLQHCGHPTALWPWALYNPDGKLVLTGVLHELRRADYGRAWPDLLTAAEWLRQHLAGDAPYTGPFRTV